MAKQEINQLTDSEVLEMIFINGVVTKKFKIKSYLFEINTLTMEQQLEADRMLSLEATKIDSNAYILHYLALVRLSFSCSIFANKSLTDLPLADKLEHISKQNTILLNQVLKEFDVLTKKVTSVLTDSDNILENFSQEEGRQP